MSRAYGITSAQQATPAAADKSVTAIDVLILPDAAMLQHTDANNARLLKQER